jgi:FMN phosphatase YigB (HAD superfamily)
VRAYKPDPRAYQIAIEAFGLARADIVFAAFGGWDAAGAKSFGYRTFWCNRLKLPTEQLDVRRRRRHDRFGTVLTADLDRDPQLPKNRWRPKLSSRSTTAPALAAFLHS